MAFVVIVFMIVRCTCRHHNRSVSLTQVDGEASMEFVALALTDATRGDAAIEFESGL